MKMIAQNVKKKVDALGRVTIPIGIRRRLNLQEGTEMEVFTLVDDGKEYIAFRYDDPTGLYNDDEKKEAI